MYWDDKYGTQTVSSDIISTMRVMMTEDSNNLPVSTSFLLDDDSSLASAYLENGNVTEMCAFANDQTPKVRKPYTISKQREKWTDQEHRRFLEALKLYGRGWRHIEEHIGTKTVVQIRSHAQKFFSKVVRESSNSAESPIKPVEIPPPRPKRKPMHPYPRKSVDTLRVASNPNHTDRSPWPNLLTASEKNNGSPTSAFSAAASEMFESVFSEQHNGCSSPTSCFTVFSEQHNGCLNPYFQNSIMDV
ncbi:hypothetical protein ACFE04_004417 [Oxalis oulophora]